MQKPPHAVKTLAFLLKPQPALWEHLIGRIASADVVCPGGHTDPHCQPGIFHVLAGVRDVSALQGTGQQGHSMEVRGQSSGSCPESMKEALVKELRLLSCHVTFCLE